MADSLVLNWNKQGVVALAASVTGETLRVSRVAEMFWSESDEPRKNPKVAGEALRAFLRQAGMPTGEALICIPRELVVIRNLSVPRVSEDDLAEIVPLQAATKSSQPLDQLIVDFLPQPDRPGQELGSVLAATLSRSYADAIQKTLAAAELEIRGFGLSTVGLAQLGHDFFPVQGHEVLMATRLNGKHLEVAFVRDSVIQLMQTSTIEEITSDVIATEFRRMMFAAQQTLGDVAVNRTVLFADAADLQKLSELKSLSADELTLVSLDDGSFVKLPAQRPQNLNVNDLVAPLGLLRNRETAGLAGLDFFKPRRKQIVADDSRRKMAIYAAGAVTLLSLGYYQFHSYVRGLDQQISQLELDESNYKTSLANGKSILETDAQLKEWLARDTHLLQELDRVQQTLPGTGQAYLNEFQFNVALGQNLAKINAEGQATNRDVIEETYRKFSAEGFKVTPATIQNGRRDSSYPAEFELNLDRPVPSSSSPRS